MENNRAIIAIALVILLWSGYSLFFPQQQQQLPADPVVAEKQQPANDEIADQSTAVVETVAESVEPVVIEGYKERLIRVTSDLYDFTLSTSGASVRSIVLNKYKETNDPDAQAYVYMPLASEKTATFKTSGSEGLSLSTEFPYVLVDDTDDTLKVENSPRKVIFKAVAQNNTSYIKTYTFYPDTYQVDIDIEVINYGNDPVKGFINMILVSSIPEEGSGMADTYTFTGPLSFNGEELLEDDIDDLEESAKIYSNSIVWSGHVTKYFLSIVSPGESAKQIQIQKIDNSIQNKFISPFVSLEPGQKTSFKYVSYVGPKDYDLLKSVGHQFEFAKDYGFFAVLAKPLMHVLKFFYGFLGNYGLAIILLTICIKIIFWPLTQKSYKSMKGMQKLQPEMQKLREKYGNDKQRLNQEMMTFYKENKVNPMGGCLPMLIQIPVFFALYQVLLGAIELRHAPFMFWIADLSAKDPYYITPLIMGGTMFLQQKMTPTNMDPNQAKIMLMMPVIFTFLFLNFPSGLVIYWMVNNLLTILQQYLIKRQPD